VERSSRSSQSPSRAIGLGLVGSCACTSPKSPPTGELPKAKFHLCHSSRGHWSPMSLPASVGVGPASLSTASARHARLCVPLGPARQRATPNFALSSGRQALSTQAPKGGDHCGRRHFRQAWIRALQLFFRSSCPTHHCPFGPFISATSSENVHPQADLRSAIRGYLGRLCSALRLVVEWAWTKRPMAMRSSCHASEVETTGELGGTLPSQPEHY
jgi:hypothetical protein